MGIEEVVIKRIARFLKLASLGVFITGIVSVLQGCSAKEGTVLAALLFLLNFCSVPMLEPELQPFTIGNVHTNSPSGLIGGGNNSYIDIVSPADGNGTITKVRVAITTATFGDITVFIARLNSGTVYDIINTQVVTATAALCPDQGSFQLCTFDVSLNGVLAGDFIGFKRPSGMRIQNTSPSGDNHRLCSPCTPVAGNTLDFNIQRSTLFSIFGSGIQM